jgi:conjugative relaxase-like TrwC/TraI family protein
MLTISKALSAGQARTYHAREFVSEKQNYWSRDAQVHSEWQGRLAQEWGLHGSVGAEEFARLSEGQHPASGAQLVKHQPAKTYDNEYGKEITSVEHRAGWDATFSAPKSVSLTALVGGDERVRVAHRESVRVALGELERYTQARIGNIHAPETTGKFIGATFEHDTARPVDGYAAPQLHTHAVIFNLTARENGQTRALQERSLFQSQQYATSVYRSDLAIRLQGLGATRSTAANTVNPRSRATRKNIWMYPVRDENRSRIICRRSGEKARARHKLLPIAHGTARRFAPRKKCYSGTANWQHGTAIRRIALSPRRANIPRFIHRARTRLNFGLNDRPLPMPAIMSSSGLPFRMSEASCRRQSAAAWRKQPTNKYGTSLRSASSAENSLPLAPSERALRRCTQPLR